MGDFAFGFASDSDSEGAPVAAAAQEGKDLDLAQWLEEARIGAKATRQHALTDKTDQQADTASASMVVRATATFPLGETTPLHHVVIDEEAVRSDTHTDLIPGEYEGGFKLWEGAADLCRFLAGLEGPDEISIPPRVMELGCGHGLPTLAAVRLWLKQNKNGSVVPQQIEAHGGKQQQDKGQGGEVMRKESLSPQWVLHDYNGEVIDELTMRNLPLNMPHEWIQHCVLLSGDWLSLPAAMPALGVHKPQLILTAETLYCVESTRKLVGTIRSILAHPMPTAAADTNGGDGGDGGQLKGAVPVPCALIATKRYYFGVGGGVTALEEAVAASNTAFGGADGRVLEMACVWQKDDGVSNARDIWRLTWSH